MKKARFIFSEFKEVFFVRKCPACQKVPFPFWKFLWASRWEKDWRIWNLAMGAKRYQCGHCSTFLRRKKYKEISLKNKLILSSSVLSWVFLYFIFGETDSQWLDWSLYLSIIFGISFSIAYSIYLNGFNKLVEDSEEGENEIGHSRASGNPSSSAKEGENG